MDLSNTTVITAITGEKDGLIEDQNTGDANFIAYIDKPWMSDTWMIVKSQDKFVDPRRNSRMPKILPHQFIDTEYSIWIDGNIKLLKTPEELIAKYLKNHDIAVFKHPSRDCLYDEATTCCKLGLDNVETIIEQVVTYEDEGFAKHKGLYECNVIFRRHTKKVEEFNNAWWAEYCRHSRRDQISFPYAVDKVGIRVNQIDAVFTEKKGRYVRDSAVEIIPHAHFEGNFNQVR